LIKITALFAFTHKKKEATGLLCWQTIEADVFPPVVSGIIGWHGFIADHPVLYYLGNLPGGNCQRKFL
jgi:hypothetical protein